MDFGNIDIRREWQNIDIFVRSPSNGWILLIENKIKSKESAGQLLRYAEAIRREFPSDQLIPVFLTLDGDDPSDEGQGVGYVPLSHLQVLEVCESIFNQYQARMPQDAKVFLSHYLSVLRRITMQDETLTSLCKSIYRKHREAIDLIVQYGASSNVIAGLEDFVDSLGDLAHKNVALNRVWWMTKDIASTLKEEELNGWGFLDKKLPFYWWFLYRRRIDGIQLCLEVGPITDPKRRKQLLDILGNAGFTFGKWAYDGGARYTRVYSDTRKLPTNEEGEPDDSAEAVMKEASGLWEKAKDKRKTLAIAVKNWTAVSK